MQNELVTEAHGDLGRTDGESALRLSSEVLPARARQVAARGLAGTARPGLALTNPHKISEQPPFSYGLADSRERMPKNCT